MIKKPNLMRTSDWVLYSDPDRFTTEIVRRFNEKDHK